VDELRGIDECLTRAMAIPGAQGVTLVDYTSGLVIATAGSEPLVDRDENAAGMTDILRAVLASPALSSTPTGDDIEDIIISGAAGYHLLALIRTVFDGQLFLHVRLDQQRGNIALARHNIQLIVREMVAP
jgi:hypothetical protein